MDLPIVITEVKWHKLLKEYIKYIKKIEGSNLCETFYRVHSSRGLSEVANASLQFQGVLSGFTFFSMIITVFRCFCCNLKPVPCLQGPGKFVYDTTNLLFFSFTVTDMVFFFSALQ